MDNKSNDDFDELEVMFGQSDSDLNRMEKVVLSQNLEGFASCFPEWDLHPPVRKGGVDKKYTKVFVNIRVALWGEK